MLIKLIVGRILGGLATLLVVSIVIFVSVELLPGDIAQAMLGREATPEMLAALRSELGLNAPLYSRYLSWLVGFVSGDMGTSLANNAPIADLIGARLGKTLILAGFAAIVAVPLSIFLGIVSALYRNSIVDNSINFIAISAISLPEFLVGYILMLILSVKLGLLPSLSLGSGDQVSVFEMLRTTLLPALTLTAVTVAHMMRMTRAAVINVLANPYIEMARLKGATNWRVILHHALPNALAPIINVTALNLGFLVVGVVVVEVVFAYPGLGRLLVDSVSKRDIPVVQACCMIFAGIYIMLNMLADVLSTITNPRLMHPR